MRQPFLFLTLLLVTLTNGEKYTVEKFTTSRSVPQMANTIIKPDSGKYLFAMQPALAKRGAFYLRRKYAEGNYGFYQGEMKSGAMDVLSRFKIEDNQFEDNTKIRFYESPGKMWNKDIEDIYFKAYEIFVPGRAFLYYYHNNKMIKLLPIPHDENNFPPQYPNEMVEIPAGCFNMGNKDGADDEKPVHKVCLDSFWIGKYEVTIGEYLMCAKAGACRYPIWLEKGNRYNIHTGIDDLYKKRGMLETYSNHAITGVSWDDAKAYCEWAGGRLPTEAEWEYAVRAGTITKYYWGDEPMEDYAWYGRQLYGKPQRVGLKKPNQWGLYDMIGNVWEWVNDWHAFDYYGKSLRKNPKGPSHGDTRVLRGGSWYQKSKYLSSSDRFKLFPHSRGEMGFRLAR